jgi:hypothetical protein
MQMVQRHMIYSPERKENSGHNQNTCNQTKKNQAQLNGYSLCSRRSSSITSEWAVLHPFSCCPAFAGFQLPIFAPLKQAGPGFTLSP